MLLDSSGVEQIGSSARGAGTSHALRAYFTAASAGQAYTSSLVASGTGRATSVYTAEAVRAAGGAVVGALVVQVAGDEVARILGRSALQDPRLTPFMVDGDLVLLHHPHADLRYRSLMPLPAARQADIRADQRFRRDEITSVGEAALASALSAARSPGNVSYESVVSGATVIAGFAPVAGHDWVVAVSEDRSTVRAPLNQLHALLLGGSLIVAALMAAVAWLAARRITKPMRLVTQAMQDLRAGDYEDARVKADRSDELGQLGRAFNALSDTLRLRDREQRPVQVDKLP